MLVLFLPLTVVVSQPEEIGDHQPNGDSRNAAYQKDALPSLAAKPLGLFHFALRQTGGKLG
jgi:hypothetical protein